MSWQDWIVALIGVTIVAAGIFRIAAGIKKRKGFDPCANCPQSDCPSRRTSASERKQD